MSAAKPDSTVALTAPDHRDPVFAYWRYGLGRTFAFTSDDRPHWAIHWLPWAGYTRFWAQTLRWSLRQNTDADFQSTVDNENGKGHLVVDAFTSQGGFVNAAKITASVVAPDLTLKPVTLSQTGPGRYEGNFDAVYRDAPYWVLGVKDIGPPLMLWAALLFLADIAVRRLIIRPAKVRDSVTAGAGVAFARAAAYRETAARPAPQPSSPQMSKLLERKTTRTASPEEEGDMTRQLLSLRRLPAAQAKAGSAGETGCFHRRRLHQPPSGCQKESERERISSESVKPGNLGIRHFQCRVLVLTAQDASADMV